jgi:hypothetical protein
MTKAFHENLDYLKTIHASMAGITAEQMINNLGIDLHPGLKSTIGKQELFLKNRIENGVDSVIFICRNEYFCGHRQH